MGEIEPCCEACGEPDEALKRGLVARGMMKLGVPDTLRPPLYCHKCQRVLNAMVRTTALQLQALEATRLAGELPPGTVSDGGVGSATARPPADDVPGG